MNSYQNTYMNIFPRKRPIKLSAEHRQQIVNRLSFYQVLTEKQYIVLRSHRKGLEFVEFYDKQADKWLQSSVYPNIEPPTGDEEKKSQFYKKVDEICAMEPENDEERCLIAFACWAGMQAIVNQDMSLMSSKDAGSILTEAQATLMKFISSNANQSSKTASEAPDSGNLLPGISGMSGNDLVGETVLDLDNRTGKITQYTIIGYKPSTNQYIVEYDDANGVECEKRFDAEDLHALLAKQEIEDYDGL